MSGSKILLNLTKDFIKSSNEESDEGYLNLHELYNEGYIHELYNDLPILPERMKIEKVEKFVTNLHDKTECVIHISNLKRAKYHGLVLEKVHRVVKFNQKAWLKPYIDMNTKLKKKVNNNLEKDVFKLVYNSVFRRTMR